MNAPTPGEREARLSAQQLEHAEYLQRRGMTLTEIAQQMDVERPLIVDALYTAKVERRKPAPVEIVPTKLTFAGKQQPGLVRLRRHDGEWLHMGADRMTLVRADSWIGTRAQLETLCGLRPDLRLLNVVRE